jgi:hypothetical protein
MRLKWPDGGLAQPAERLVDIQGGARCAHRIVIVRSGRAEERHYRIADMLVDRTPITNDNAVDERRVAAHQFTDLFRIERSRHCGELAKIGEENSNLPALSCRQVIRMSYARRYRHASLGNCRQQSLTVTERGHAELF